jgi:hypothetical protein
LFSEKEFLEVPFDSSHAHLGFFGLQPLIKLE